jgi:serine/threonine protein kinase/lipopolysaccharide biosynthesis regulator YciM
MSERLESVNGSMDALLGQVADEFTDRINRGERPEVEEYARRYPEMAEVLRQVLPALQVMGSGASPVESGGAQTATSEALVSGCLGDFRILREVGRGGMGIVYEAEQVSLRRRVALKMLRYPGVLDPRQLQRFQNEARAAACLHHTNIVPVHYVGCERGVHFYAMQFIDGQTLAALIAQRRQTAVAAERTTAYPPPVGPAAAETAPAAQAVTRSGSGSWRGREDFRRLAQLGVQAAEALDHAHQAGIVHRDIKPANLMLDERGTLWVTDFGLAHVQHGEASLTMSGDLVGTLRYMSPEQALAKRVVIDHRTDVYSLGVTLYELLSLRPAFGGRDREELLRQVAFEEPLRPRRIDRAIPAELETIVLKAMEKNPAERYATAQELADDLRRWLDGQLIRARRPTLVQQAGKWLRRHPALVRSTMALVLLAALASATGAWLLWQKEKQTQQERDRADRAREAAEKGADILGSVFRELDPQAEEKGGPTLRVQLGEQLEDAARLLQEEAVGDPLTVARLQGLLGNSLRGLGHFDKALPLLEQARQTREAALGADHPDSLESKNHLAVLYQAQGKYEQAEPLFQEVLQGLTAKLGADHPSTQASNNNLAQLYKERGQYERAEPLFQKALQGLTARLGADHPDTLASKDNLAGLYQHQGKYEQAESLYKELLQGFTARLGADHPDTLFAKNNLAVLYKLQGKYEQAEPLFQEVLQGLTAKLGADHPKTLVSKNNLAQLYTERGQYERAEPLLQQALQGWTARLGADHPFTLAIKSNLAALYRVQGQYKQAEPLLSEALRGLTARLGANHPDTLTSKDNLAQLYQAQGKYDRAEALQKEALQGRTDKLGADHPNTLESKNNLAVVYWSLRKLDRSVPLFEDVVRSRKTKLGADHPATLNAAFNLAVNYRDAGRLDEAVALLDEYLPRARAVLPPDSPIRNFGLTDGAEAYSRAGRFDKAELLLRERADLVKQQAGVQSPPYAGQLAVLGLNLLQQKKYAEAEKVVRECLAIREKKGPDAWNTFNTRSMLGGALLGQKKYSEAEPLLLQGYEGLKQREDKIPPPGRVRLSEAVERLVQLYDAWGRKDKAAEWRKRLPPELLPPPTEEAGR